MNIFYMNQEKLDETFCLYNCYFVDQMAEIFRNAVIGEVIFCDEHRSGGAGIAHSSSWMV